MKKEVERRKEKGVGWLDPVERAREKEGKDWGWLVLVERTGEKEGKGGGGWAL